MSERVFHPISRSRNSFLLVQVTILFLILLAGKFTFSRIFPGLAIPLLLDQVAFWLILLLLVLVIADQSLRRRSLAPLTDFSRRWIGLAVLLHLTLAFAAVWSPVPDQALVTCFQMVAVGVVLCLLPLIFRGVVATRYFLSMFLLAAAVYSVVGLLRGLIEQQERIAMFGGGPNVFVRVTGGGILIALYFSALQRRRAWLLSIPLFALAALLSGSRGGVLAICLATGFFLISLWRNGFIRAGDMFSGSLLIGIGLLVVLPIAMTVGAYALLQSRFGNLVFQQLYWSSRDVIFFDAWEMFRQHPVWGVGLGGYAVLTETGFAYPHNLILHVASESGIFGLMPLILAIVLAFVPWFRRVSLEGDALFSLALLYFAASMLSGGLYDARLFWFLTAVYMIEASRNPLVPYRRFKVAAMSGLESTPEEGSLRWKETI